MTNPLPLMPPAQAARRRTLGRLAGAAGLIGLPGLMSACASLNTWHCTVSSFGAWPQGRAPGRYAFDRLPSQQSKPELAAELEAAVAQALLAAGLAPAEEGGAAPDVLVQVGARISVRQPSPWDDPFWPRPWGPWGGWAGGRFGGPRPYRSSLSLQFQFGMNPPDYVHEAALLIRDKASNQSLYEGRASHDGRSAGTPELLSALFQATLADFPATRAEPHDVAIQRP